MRRKASLILATLLAFVLPIVIVVNLDSSGGIGLVQTAECPPGNDLPTLVPTIQQLETPSPSATATRAPAATLTESPEPTSTPGGMLALQKRLTEAMDQSGVQGRFAVAITDLQTDETIGVNGDRQQLAGCSINLFVLLQVALDLQNGRYPVERVDSLMASTTWSSNAVTARDLYAVAGDGDAATGVRRVAQLMADLGLQQSRLNHPPLFREIHDGQVQENLITAYEANSALRSIWLDAELDEEWRAYLLDHLTNVKPGLNYLLGSVASTAVTVSHKNGFFEYDAGFVDNDVGIIQLDVNGQSVAFAMSFLSEDVPVKYGDVPLGQTLVRLALDYFLQAYGQ